MNAHAAGRRASDLLSQSVPAWLRAILITVGGAVILLVLTGAWSSKENAADHRADIDAVRGDIQRVLDVVCMDKPTARPCK